MPRSLDPSLIGNQLPFDHSPLSRIDYQSAKMKPVDLDALMASFELFIQNFLIPVIKELTGLDLSSFDAFVESVFGSDTPPGFVNDLYAVLGELDFSSPTAFFKSLLGALNIWPELYEQLTGDPAGDLRLLGNYLITQLFGPVTANRLPMIPVSHIGVAEPNLLASSTFDTATTIDGAGIWAHDPDEGHTTPGCAVVTADGTLKELLSSEFGVAEGQEIVCSAWTKWSGLAATNTVALGITGYQDGSAIATSTLITDTSGLPTTGWRELSATYTVGPDVNSMRIRLLVTANAGTVWFDDVTARKTGLLPQDHVRDLTGDLNSMAGQIGTLLTDVATKVFQGDFDGLLEVLGGPSLTAIGEKWEAFLDRFSPLNADNIFEGTIADQFVPGLSQINNTIVQNMQNVFDKTFPEYDDVASAFRAMRLSVTDSASRVLALENKLTDGISDFDDFERVGSNLGAGWLVLYGSGAGTVGTPDSHHATWQPSGVADREFVAIRTADTGGYAHSQTNFQRVGLALAAKSEELFGYAGHHYLWLRISDTTTSLANITGIRYGFGGDGTVYIDRFVNGVRTRLTPEILVRGTTPAGPGAVVYADAGLPGIARFFRISFGLSPILQMPEVGTASGLGPTFTRWGWGARVEGHLLPLPGQTKWGAIHAWSAKDQVIV